MREVGTVTERSSALDAAVAAYLRTSYPRNHRYRVVGQRLVPSWRLWRRDRAIRRTYPAGSTSLLDLSVSMGWFALTARRRRGFERVLGIDVHEPDLAAARAVRDHLGLSDVRFERLRLHELAADVDAFGGPFDVVLCINLYHYLVIGSRRLSERYASHAEAFEHLAAVTRGALVFSNCTTLQRLPGHLRALAVEAGVAADYTPEAIRAAAAPWFELEDLGRLGTRPLWRLVRRG